MVRLEPARKKRRFILLLSLDDRVSRAAPDDEAPLYPGRAGAAGDPVEVVWHGTRPGCPDWSPGSRVLALEWRGTDDHSQADVVYCAMNMYWEPLDYGLPSPPSGQRWRVFANTSLPTPQDIWEPEKEPPLIDQERILVGGRSTVVLVAR